MKEYASPKMGKVGNRPVPSKGGNTEPRQRPVVIAWVDTSSVTLNMPELMGLCRNTNEP